MHTILLRPQPNQWSICIWFCRLEGISMIICIMRYCMEMVIHSLHPVSSKRLIFKCVNLSQPNAENKPISSSGKFRKSSTNPLRAEKCIICRSLKIISLKSNFPIRFELRPFILYWPALNWWFKWCRKLQMQTEILRCKNSHFSSIIKCVCCRKWRLKVRLILNYDYEYSVIIIIPNTYQRSTLTCKKLNDEAISALANDSST